MVFCGKQVSNFFPYLLQGQLAGGNTPFGDNDKVKSRRDMCLIQSKGFPQQPFKLVADNGVSAFTCHGDAEPPRKSGVFPIDAE